MKEDFYVFKYHYEQNASEHSLILITSTSWKATKDKFELTFIGYEMSNPGNRYNM